MANEDIKNAINKVQNEIIGVQMEINALNSELSNIETKVSSCFSRVNATHNNFVNCINNSANAIDYANNSIQDTIECQLQIRELYFIFKEIETANKKIRALRNKLFYDFRNQARVRKIVNGLVDNLNFGLVSNETIFKAIEKEHLQSPDFWLTYSLLAIMYWKENDKEKVERCVNESLKLNEKSTILFMMQFNLILHRYEVALKWLKIYETLPLMGSDDKTLLMIISSINSKVNNFDDRVDPFALEIMNYVKTKLEADNLLVDHNQLVDNVCSFMEKFDVPETLQYENYRKYVSDYQNMAEALSKAKNNSAILEYFMELSHIDENEKNVVLDNYLQNLISEPCEGEKKIFDEIDYNEEILKAVDKVKESKTLISKVDFKKIAEDSYESKKHHDEAVLNSVIETLNWTYSGTNENITSLTKWNLFVLNKDYAIEGYKKYQKKYKALNTLNHDVNIEDYKCKTDFKNLDTDLNRIDKYIDDKKQLLLKNAKKPLFYIGIVLTIVFVVLGILAQILLSNIVLMVLGLIFAGVSIIMAIYALLSNISKKNNIIKMTENNRKKIKEVMSNIYSDKEAYDKEFAQAHSISQDIKEFFNKI